MLDECHKAKTVDLDESGKAKNVGKSVKCSQTAAKVVELQAYIPVLFIYITINLLSVLCW